MTLPGAMTVMHVVLGSVALAAVPAALSVRKGGTLHKRAGALFVVSMTGVLFSAAFLWQAKGHVFLVPLGIISAYLLYIALRATGRRRTRPQRRRLLAGIDLAAAGIALGAAATCIVLGTSGATPLLREIAPALIGIGGIGASYAANELVGMAGPRSRLGPLLTHLAAMLAAYISAVTAFIVINAHAVPMMLRWAVPALLGGMTIAWYASGALGLRGRIARPVAPATPSGDPAPLPSESITGRSRVPV